MKVSYPLSLKVSLWLMLNLLLLAALGVGFFVVQGGLGWGALVAGPTGDRAQALFNVISGEASAATGEARTAVLKRFADAYSAEFALFGLDESQIAGAPMTLPHEVKERMEFRGPGGPGFFGGGPPGGWGGFGGKGFGGGRRGGGGPPPPEGELDPARKRDPGEKSARESGDPAARDTVAEKGAPPLPPPDKGPPPFDRGRFGDGGRRGGDGGPGPGSGFGGGPPDRFAGRFVVRGGSPSGYWVGMRVPFVQSERGGRPMPAKLVARVGSLWSLLSLLGLQPLLLGGGGVLALSVLFWLPLVRSITRSLGQLTTATDQIAQGKFETRVASHRRDEIGQLGDSVNRMAARLDAHMNGQKRFLGDVAHELCSPLARLQMTAGILADQATPATKDTIADLRDEVQQMSTLVNELLAFTKAGLAPREIALAPVALAPLAEAALAREGATGRVTLDIPAELSALADADLLGRAVGNLVRNALRYAGDAGPITVAAAREGERVVLTVEDQGPGVPTADLVRLGEPFFRPELARTRESGGVGLGLAIVRDSIAACRGEVRFANREPHGFRAEIRLAAV